jgi:hypothetical protein
MATTYKTLTNNDVASTRTLLHEAIPITGSIISGTYGAGSALGSEPNVKNFPHEMFQSVYDYPYLSSSANHILDITCGYATSSIYAEPSNSHHDKKINVYNQMAQVLAGYDFSADIREFDEDGNYAAGGNKLTEAIFVNFSRLLVKDEIKKGTFSIALGDGPTYASPFAVTMTLQDASGNVGYKVNSPAGEYGILYNTAVTPNVPMGLIFYQAGVMVMNASGTFTAPGVSLPWLPSGEEAYEVLTGSYSQEAFANGFRHRISNISFNNTVELNSTVYFCRANHNEFNYSSNPTYVSGSKIQVKNVPTDAPVSYITTVGLYSSDNELLAVAKLSEPLKKDPTNEVTLRVRLDY